VLTILPKVAGYVSRTKETTWRGAKDLKEETLMMRHKLGLTGGLAVALLYAQPLLAQTTTVACSDTTILPNPVYIAGSSAFEPMLAQFAVQMKAKQGISVIYSPISSCSGVTQIEDPTQTLTGTAHYYVADTTQPTGYAIQSCTLPSGTKPIVGVSDVAYESCTGKTLPATVGTWDGPVQSMLIIVRKENVTTTALSAEQAAAIFGCGAKGGISPFLDDNAIQVRTSTSGTQTMIARNIGVPETAFKGHSNSGGSGLITSMLNVADPQTAIGILAADAYATQRTKLSAVAFRGLGQKKAYYPDSDANSLDKKNVRTGHYMINGPLHFFASVSNGQPVATTKKILDFITGAVPIDPADPNNKSYITTVATAGNVPTCAMKVKIDKDGGYFSPYTPPTSCGCFFEQAAAQSATAPAGCVACTTDAQCTGGKRCQTGYCE
jgi:ABC-type phosphate transport system substrate-binding protein